MTLVMSAIAVAVFASAVSAPVRTNTTMHAPAVQAAPSSVRARLDAAAAAIAAGDPDLALTVLQPRAPMTFVEYIEHRRLLATARAFVDDVDGAVAAFDELLASEPTFTMPYTASPRVTVAFERARAARRGHLPLAFDLNAPALAAPQIPIAIEVRRRSDPGHTIATLLLDVDVPGSGEAPATQTLPVDDAGIVRCTVPAPPITESSPADDDGRRGVLLRLRVRGLDSDGVERFVGAPVSVPVGFAATPSVWASPWLWGSAAAVVVAGAVVAVVAVRLATVPDTAAVDVEVRR